MELQSGKFYMQKRYFITLTVCLAWSLLFLMRANLSISIVDMTSNKSVIVGNKTIIQVAEFDWTSKEKGLILSAFAWGFATAPLGAFVSKKCGGVVSFGIGVTLTGLLTVLTPFFMRCHVYIYLAARTLEGVAEGVSATSAVDVFRMWSTPKDRTRLMGVAVSGTKIGAMLGYPVCGTIAYYLDWQGVFYITGGVSLMLSLLWFTLLRNSPEEDSMMTLQEKQYLKQFNSYTSRTKVASPWKQILTSKAVWAYWNEQFVGAWSENFLAFSLPLYIKDIHDINVRDIGFITAIPQFCAVVGLICASFLADVLRNRRILSPSNVHKSYFAFGQFIAVVLLVIVALSEHFLTGIICFCLFRLFFTICKVSYYVLPVDMAGQYGSLILGIGHSACALGHSISPIIMGLSVTHHTSAEWSTYFLILSSLNIIMGRSDFFKFGSGELQSWAAPSDSIENVKH